MEINRRSGTKQEQEEEQGHHNTTLSLSWPPSFACRSPGGHRPLGAPRLFIAPFLPAALPTGLRMIGVVLVLVVLVLVL